MANLRTNNLSGEGGKNALNGSVYFDGYVADDTPTSYISVPDSDDLDMGTGDFTFECWLLAVKHNGTNSPNYMGIFSSNSFTAGGFLIQVNNTGPLRLVIPLAAGGNFEESAGPELWGDGTSSNRNWNHIAVTRVSGTIKGYVNGIEVISASHNVGVDFAHGGSANIGENSYATYGGDYPLRGHISNLRICKGHAVYTGNFTPPTSPLTAHYISENDKTVLLCCQDSDNPLQEATGKTLTGYGRHPSEPFDENGEGPELVTSTGVWSLSHIGTQGNFTVSENGTKLSGTTSTSAYMRASLTTNTMSKYRVRLFYEAGDDGDLAVGSDTTGYFQDVDDNAKTLPNGPNTLVVGKGYMFEQSGNSDIQITAQAWSTTYSITQISIKQISNGDMPKVHPPFGRDAGNNFGGAISMNSSGHMYLPTGTTEERITTNNKAGTRGLVFQGLTYPAAPNRTYLNSIEYITVASKGDATDFGDLTNQPNSGSGAGNLTRGIQVAGNIEPGGTNVIQYVTIASTGNATDFGDVGYQLCNSGAVSNQTRLVYSGGESPVSPNPRLNNIEFITFATTGNGVDFGDQMTLVNSPYGVSSPSRGVFMGGSGATPTIQKIEIATTGNSVLFGDLNSALYNVRGTITNGHRGVMAGGVVSPVGRVNRIEYISIQSGGQSLMFGDLTDARDPSNLSSMTRGVMLSGDYPANVNIMDFIEIMTTGNAVDFGDCNKSAASSTASNGHGGLADDM